MARRRLSPTGEVIRDEHLAMAGDFTFPAGAETRRQVRNLHDLCVWCTRAEMTTSGVPAEVLADAFGLELRRSQEIVAEVMNWGMSAISLAAAKLFRGMVDGRYPSTANAHRGRESRWLFGLVYDSFTGVEGEWRDAAPADLDLLQRAGARFMLDYREWKRGEG